MASGSAARRTPEVLARPFFLFSAAQSACTSLRTSKPTPSLRIGRPPYPFDPLLAKLLHPEHTRELSVDAGGEKPTNPERQETDFLAR